MALVLIVLDAGVGQMFVVAGALFAIFAAPIFLVVREHPSTEQPITRELALRSLGQLRETIDHARGVPGLGRFLLGYLLFKIEMPTLLNEIIVLAYSLGVIGLALTLIGKQTHQELTKMSPASFRAFTET